MKIKHQLIFFSLALLFIRIQLAGPQKHLLPILVKGWHHGIGEIHRLLHRLQHHRFPALIVDALVHFGKVIYQGFRPLCKKDILLVKFCFSHGIDTSAFVPSGQNIPELFGIVLGGFVNFRRWDHSEDRSKTKTTWSFLEVLLLCCAQIHIDPVKGSGYPFLAGGFFCSDPFVPVLDDPQHSHQCRVIVRSIPDIRGIHFIKDTLVSWEMFICFPHGTLIPKMVQNPDSGCHSGMREPLVIVIGGNWQQVLFVPILFKGKDIRNIRTKVIKLLLCLIQQSHRGRDSAFHTNFIIVQTSLEPEIVRSGGSDLFRVFPCPPSGFFQSFLLCIIGSRYHRYRLILFLILFLCHRLHSRI